MTAVHSQNEYRRLGDRIRKDPNHISLEDLAMLQDLRVTYRDPLAKIFNAIETLASRIDKECVCTYRVKRIESIISKLQRLPKMQLQRAEDIAGCRVIMTDVIGVKRLFETIQKKEDKLPFEIKGINDYISNPKETGYRSIHVNVQLKGDNRRIEIQLRALEHHNWATLVEITDLIYGTRLKELGRDANPELFDFHRILSKNNSDMDKNEREFIASTAMKYQYLERIGSIFQQNYLNVRKQWNKNQKGVKTFILIATDSTGIPEFQTFKTFDEAENEYFLLYSNNTDSKNIVLTHVKDKSFKKISTAYSNYFLTYNAILIRIHDLFADAIINSYKKCELGLFSKLYRYYLNTIKDWLQKDNIERNEFKQEHMKSPGTRTRAKDEWFYSMENMRYYISMIFTNIDKELTLKPKTMIQFFVKKRIKKKELS